MQRPSERAGRDGSALTRRRRLVCSLALLRLRLLLLLLPTRRLQKVVHRPVPRQVHLASCSALDHSHCLHVCACNGRSFIERHCQEAVQRREGEIYAPAASDPDCRTVPELDRRDAVPHYGASPAQQQQLSVCISHELGRLHERCESIGRLVSCGLASTWCICVCLCAGVLCL